MVLAIALPMLPACGNPTAPEEQKEPEQIEATASEAEPEPEQSDDGDSEGEGVQSSDEMADAEAQPDADDPEELATDSHHLDQEGRVELNSILELDGEHLAELLTQSGYVAGELPDGLSFGSDSARCELLLTVLGEDVDPFDAEAMEQLGAGGEGIALEYLVRKPGVVTDDPLISIDKSDAYRVEVRDGLVAYSFTHVPTGRRYFVTVTRSDEEGFVEIRLYNQEAVESGLLGDEESNILNEVWL